ncbi:hypothetical protein PVL29_022349 [Vitis rotundifolia]|uniref:USP domain-containing protein n=1 Tax=Vitis rotundifolia TaxID=103349 RepID=A0AA39DCK1_VITRO|nr:hypothetical protein PVL29_022349 [Vitis rotundifolia]
MGHKKRTLAPRSKGSPGGTAVGGDGANSAEAEQSPNLNVGNSSEKSKMVTGVESEGSAYSAIKLECERSLTALRRGNHNKALRIMKELSVRHDNSVHSALIHRVQGTVCVKVASIIDDPNAKQRHLKNAIETAKKAVELSPNSIEFAHFYANLLYEAASEGKEYEEVVHECERALSIDSPVDPAKESLQDESQQKISTVEARIGHVQNELRSLIQKSNIASISTWMKNLGNGEEKFRLIPIRRVSEDPMEVRLVQSKRPNEIKKATKTQEERRKEIEVRVAAARLLQQKSDAPQSQSEGDRTDKASETSSGPGQRVGERRKNARKFGSTVERKDRVRSYWNSMSFNMRKDLLKIRISDLKAHFSSVKDGLASGVLSEALSFVEVNKVWKFWVCCRCGEKFKDSESHMQHVVQEHMGNLLPKMQSVLPQNIDNEWIEMIVNCSWKPLDISAAVKMLKNESKCQQNELVDEFYTGNNTGECINCFKDAWESSPEKGMLGDGCSCGNLEKSDSDKIPNNGSRECDGNEGSKAYSLANSWPLADDSERAKLLEKIHVLFEMLIKHKCLAGSHLSKVMQFTTDELQGIASGSQLLNYGVDQTPMCICFLGASQLRKLLKFLQELSHACGLARSSDKTSSAMDDANSLTRDFDIKENVLLNGDASCLLLDEHLLPTENTSTASHVAVTDDAAAETSPIICNENGVQPDGGSLLSWIFTGPSSVEQLASWMRIREEKSNQGMEILQMLEKEFYHLQSLCERKCEHLSYEEALQAVEDLCLEEGKKRENVTDFGSRSLESVLRKRREELAESENEVMLISNRFELDAIINVLKEAESLNMNQFGYEEHYNGVTSHLCDLESGEDDDWRSKDFLHQMDACIEVAIQRQKEQLSVELSKIDARIMRNVTGMQQLELTLEPVSAFDYRSIILPLLKSFMRAHLEDLAEKDATQKSDAAREAFLAELALDSKKSAIGGSDNSRHNQDKTKEKKKSKEYRKMKDSKGTGGSEQHVLHHVTTEQDSSPVASDGEHPDSEPVVSVNDDNSKHQEEELRRKIELEAEERKLEETLEYQRRIENEAKQKHLAEQRKKTTGIIPEKVVTGLSGGYLNPSADEHDAHEQLEHFKQKSQFPNSFDGMPRDVIDGTTVPIDSITGSANQSLRSTPGQYHAKVEEGLPNGGSPVDGVLLSERRIGRKTKRQKNSTKLIDGKYQAVSSGKENVEVGISHIEDRVKEQVKIHGSGVNLHLGDNGTKTLRQLQAEEDDEERFQADLKQAVRQSLDTYQAHQKLPLVSSLRMPQRMSHEVDDVGLSPDDVVIKNMSGADMLGTGLKNEVGEYNCFLNSLWHLRRFRNEFLGRSTSEHVHVGDPCVVCALYEIFTALSVASTDTRREAVAPSALRIALSNLYPDSNFFQEAQMNDASEVLGVIFDCLHRPFTSSSSISDTESVESNCMGSWDCANSNCLAHSLFGMDIFERMNCYNCSLESRHLKYTSFFHNINASALRTMKVMCAESPFDELLNLVEMNHQLACDPEAGGCGKFNYIHHILSTPPHVFTIVLGWQNTCESADDITATLAALDTEIDVSVLYRGLDPKNRYCLVSVVCYYGQHYHCFAYSHEHEQWVMYDDKTVKVIGSWDNVLTMCERGHLQPQVLFFEAVN